MIDDHRLSPAESACTEIRFCDNRRVSFSMNRRAFVQVLTASLAALGCWKAQPIINPRSFDGVRAELLRLRAEHYATHGVYPALYVAGESAINCYAYGLIERHGVMNADPAQYCYGHARILFNPDLPPWAVRIPRKLGTIRG